MTTEKQRYVLGFMFNSDATKVALIRKNKPKWQEGKLNGIGGKVELDEISLTAMVREFEEETGVKTLLPDWENYAFLDGDYFSMDVYYCHSDEYCYSVKTIEQEEVGVYNVADIISGKEDTISNLPWLITAALDTDQPRLFLNVRYTN